MFHARHTVTRTALFILIPGLFTMLCAQKAQTRRCRHERRRLLLHLINFTGEMTRPIRQVVLVQNVRVSLSFDGKARFVRTVMRPATLTATRKSEGRLQFVLPRVEECEFVAVDRQE